MPRQALLDYMLARVVRNCPNFFDKYVQFDTAVTKVHWDESLKKFRVTSQHSLTGQITNQYYDKFIWAAGNNGLPYMPPKLLESLSRFAGKVIHSTETANFGHDVAGKRVLIVGGSYSAEDLALMACKIGVERVYISSRTDDSVVSWMGSWPDDKVEYWPRYIPVGASGSTVRLRRTVWIKDDHYEIDSEDDEEEELENIDTIILCTGYREQFGMLEPQLRRWKDGYTERTFDVPKNWTMKENSWTPFLNDVPNPRKARFYGSMVSYPDLYRNSVLIDNPNALFLHTIHDDYPILVVDAQAWWLMQYTTGGIILPSRDDMRLENMDQALYEMSTFPTSRFSMDEQYGNVYRERQPKFDPDWELYLEEEKGFEVQDMLVLARTMQEANYPISIGDYASKKLTKHGEILHDYGYKSYYHRVNATTTKTFRDADDSHEFKSLFTGTKAVPLRKLWLDLDERSGEELV
jgi:thioredoxin reductase